MGETESLRGRVTGTDPESRRVLHDLTVIIPTVGRPILEKCLRSIAVGTVLPALTIVVDQGENAAVVDWLHNVSATGLDTFHLVSSERSPASARNRGVEQARTRFVAAIDDDCVAAVDWLEKMEIRLQQNPKAIVTGRLEAAGDGIPPTIVTSAVPCIYTRPSVRIHSPLASANMGFALETARRIGPFDRHLMTAEENDWAYRALRVGIPIIFAPELIVHHLHWRNNAQLATVYRAYAWGQGAFYGKHLREGDWSMAVRTALSLFRGGRDLFYGVLNNDFARRVNGSARVTRLLPGLFWGLRGMGPP